jgi:hypothetical protein
MNKSDNKECPCCGYPSGADLATWRAVLRDAAGLAVSKAMKENERLRKDNEQLQEENEDLNNRYHFLATEMVYEGNSVQHWRQKALAYKECAGFVSDVKQLLKQKGLSDD